MSSHVDAQPGRDQPGLATDNTGRTELWAAGALMAGGWLLTIVATLFHPAGQEDDHELIFAEYAESGAWVAVHLVQFAGVLIALGGLLVLYRVVRAAGRSSLLATVAAAAAVATAGIWAVLQGLDGVGLKQAADAWHGASGSEERIRFANAETVRWLEWGLQSYFRVLLGLTFGLFGAAVLASRLIAGWLGWMAVLAGLVSVVIGIDVGYSGLASELQDALGVAFLAVGLVFAVGVLATGLRERGRRRAVPA